MKPDAEWTAYDLPLAQEAGPDLTVPPRGDTDGRALLENEAWFCSLRWLVIAALAATGLLGWASSSLVPGIHLEPGWPLAVAGVLLVLNVFYLAVVRLTSRSSRPALLAMRGLWLQIILDLAALTAVVHFVGSVGTFAPFMYLFHIVLACIFLRNVQSLLVMLVAMGMYLACLALEGTGVIAPGSMLTGALAPDRGAVPFLTQGWHFASVAFVSATVWYLASRLSAALRRRDEELLAGSQRLQAATEERARYMLRTTHQLKAPFAAIHANTQLLRDGYCGVLPEQAVPVIEQIAARCEMLSRGIKAMLQLSNLRSASQDPPGPVAVDVSALVGSCLAGLRPQAAKRGIVVDEELSPATAMVVPDHAVMIFDNILSNAIAYSHEGQRIRVSSRGEPGGGAVVVVRDTGIGILPDKLPRIFDDYYRTAEAARHNPASTGLGLAIVRQSALTGGIGVRVESAPARGTVFTLTFPGSPVKPGEPA